MEIIHFDQRNLATRWCVSEATLERWRTEGIGPKYLKLCGRVLYRLVDFEEYESAHLHPIKKKTILTPDYTHFIELSRSVAEHRVIDGWPDGSERACTNTPTGSTLGRRR